MTEFTADGSVPIVRLRDAETLRYVDQWQTLADFTVELNNGLRITVPSGFVYDKASIPRLVWPLLPRDDRNIIDAALVHDYLYTVQKIDDKWIPRIAADKIFKELMHKAGMGFFKCHMAYAGVRMGGWVAYNPRAKAKKNPYYEVDKTLDNEKLPFDPTRKL